MIYRGYPDYMLDGVVRFLAALLPLFERTPGGVADLRLYSAYRRSVADMRRDPRAAARSPYLGQTLANVVSAYRRASSDQAAAFEGLERIATATRAFVPVDGTTAPKLRQRRVELALCGLVETCAVAQAAHAIAGIKITSRNQADALRLRVGRLFTLAIDRAAERGGAHVQRRLVTLAGWITRDLIDRGRPLSQIVAYETAVPLPAAVLAHKLYADAGRMAELVAQNPAHDHPSFMPLDGRTLSN